jgi:hypothetical protein
MKGFNARIDRIVRPATLPPIVVEHRYNVQTIPGKAFIGNQRAAQMASSDYHAVVRLVKAQHLPNPATDFADLEPDAPHTQESDRAEILAYLCGIDI